MDYNEFRTDALKQYADLPDELNELYKKYYMPIQLPEQNIKSEEPKTKETEKLKALVDDIEKKTRIKFDLVFSNSYIKNNTDFIKIKKMEELYELLDKKIYKSSDNKLAAFVNAHATYALTAKIEKGKKHALNILFVNSADLIFEVIFEIEKDAEISISELFMSTSENDALIAPLQEFLVSENAILNLDIINNCNKKTTVLNLSKGILMDHSKTKINFVYNGGKMTKAINFFNARGKASSIDATEILYGTGEQRFDINTYVINEKENTNTHLETGAVLDGNSQCILKGYAKVDKWTKGAISRVNERGIIISENAHIDALPDMSIDYSEQVSATHSAATSPIDKEVLFYMTARGIEESKARKMFVASFLSKYLSEISRDVAKELASSIMLSRIENDDFGVINDTSPKGIWLTEKTEEII